MSNLTTGQRDSIIAGQPIKQRFWMRVPLVADHSVMYDVLFEEGIYNYHWWSMEHNRVLKAGKRKHVVWNPHPSVPVRASALRWSFEVRNEDDYFNNGTGGIFYYSGAFQAEPQECFVIHKIYVLNVYTKTWSEITHMAFTGRILSVEYEDSARPDKWSDISGFTIPAPVPERAVITCQQAGVWETLLRKFDSDDADRSTVDALSGSAFYLDVP